MPERRIFSRARLERGSVANSRFRPFSFSFFFPPPIADLPQAFQNRQFPSGKLHFSVTEALETWAPCKFLRKWPLRATRKSTPQPPIFDDSFEKSIQRVFWQLSFLIYCLITFCANPPATVRFWDDSLRKNRRKKRHRNAPRNSAGYRGRAIKTSSKKHQKSSNQRINDAPPKQRRL